MGAVRHVGIDLGGTSIKAGALDASGERLGSATRRVDLARGPGPVLDAMAELARELGVAGSLGVGTPGLFERPAGLITESPNLAAMEGVALAPELARRLGLDEACIAVENDANAAAVGEHRLGAGRGVRDLALLTLGTGVGGGLVLGGELWIGAGLAGEIGHVPVQSDGPPCGCGNRGCLEQLASATAARRRAAERGLLATADAGDDELAALTRRARERDGPERELLLEVGVDLGRGLGVIVTLLDLRTFLIGGGFGAALDVLLPGVRRGLARTSYGERLSGVRVEPAALGSDAGWIGAALIGAGRAT